MKVGVWKFVLKKMDGFSVDCMKLDYYPFYFLFLFSHSSFQRMNLIDIYDVDWVALKTFCLLHFEKGYEIQLTTGLTSLLLDQH
jgi:hypothetical protein